MAVSRRLQVQLAVLAVVAILAAWQYLGPGPEAAPGQAPGAPARGAGAPTRRAAVSEASVPADVALDRLAAAHRGPDGADGRNPFVFGAGPVAESDPGARRPVSRPEAAPPPLPPMVPMAPPLPPIPFKFIGLVEGAERARRIAVLSDSKGLVVHGAEGAIIDGRFRILAIGSESIDIAYADGRGRQTLRLSGQ